MNWRLGYAGLCATAALLTVLPAPTYHLWLLALAVTEWGHVLALLSLVAFVPGWRRSRRGYLAAALAAFAFFLAWTPWMRAAIVAKRLPAQLTAAFGSKFTSIQLSPFSVADALHGIPIPDLRWSTRTYALREGRALQMDIYNPGSPSGPLPAVLVIHGGGWSSGKKSEFPEFDAYLAERGYVVADMEYRLAPKARFPAALEDVRSAVAYLKSHSQELGLDPSRMTLLGRSAGGQLALLAAYDAPDPAIRGVVAFYAPTDLVFAYANPANPWVLRSRETLESYLGGSPEHVRGLYEKASPFNFVGPNTVPTLLIHGGRDELVRKNHSERLNKALFEMGRPCFYLSLPWATHGCDFNLSGPCGQLSLFALERFLAAVNGVSEAS